MKNLVDFKNINRRAILSTFWIFVLLNVIFRDIHELFRPRYLQEIVTGTANGRVISDGQLLVAGIFLELTIVMVILSRVLSYRANRWANIIVGVLSVIFILTNGVNDLDDLFFAIVEVTALAVIVVLAWRWPERKGQAPIGESRSVMIPTAGE
ncbi:MAG: DUF6326 family protein [Candidatus Promineifilaceae bacterium]|nr:DUF6326 family protein [Candidatus Promineifilaceae bacterium]